MPILDLPVAPEPIGAYVRGTLHEGIGMLSGQFPIVDGVVLHPGRLGAELTVAQGQEAASAAARNALAQIDRLLKGFDRLEGIMRVDGIIAATDDFQDHARVLDGASDAINTLLGARGRHARTLLPVQRLPLNAAIELIVTFAYRR